MTGRKEHLLEYVTRARTARTTSLARIALTAAALLPFGVAALPAVAVADDRDDAAAWSGIFDALRPVPSLDSRHVVVLFDAPSLAEWSAASDTPLAPAAQRAFVVDARKQQDARLAEIQQQGVEFTLEQRYTRVVNGVSLIVHGDEAQRLRFMPGIRAVSAIRAVYPARLHLGDEDTVTPVAPTAASTSTVTTPTAPAAPTAEHDAAGTARPVVAVLDTGIDFNHPALTQAQAAPGTDAVNHRDGVDPGDDDSHGTEVAGGVVLGADGTPVSLLPVRVLERQPVLGGLEATVGTTDTLLAGFEVAVDPNGDGATDDHAAVALAAVSVPYAGFSGTPEELAVTGAEALGTITVAAAGNDGAGGDTTGTVGGPAAARDALAVGAADLRKEAPRVDVHARGGVLDVTWSNAPLLTPDAKVPSGPLSATHVAAPGGEVADYLGDDARSRVAGSAVLVSRTGGVSIADQGVAAADAGAAVVLVGGADADDTAGALRARGVDIPVIGISRDAARALVEALADGDVELDFSARAAVANRKYGSVAGFSSRGPRYDGIGKPDVVAAGVGVFTSTLNPLTSTGEALYAPVNGTSIAAAQVAGQVAALRALHPGWTAERVKAALLGTATPLGGVGSRPALEAQGAGVISLHAAATAEIVAEPARLDFGIVTPGSSGTQPLTFRRVRTGAAVPLPQLTSERSGPDGGPLPAMVGDALVVQVPEGTASGVYGGWLVNARDSVRVPWMVVVRQPDEFDVPVTASLSDATFAAVAGAGQVPSTLQISVGGSSSDGSLGLRAAQRIELRLQNPKGDDLGVLGSLDHVLPGVYTLGLSGRDAQGTPLPAGKYSLAVRVRSAAAPGGAWISGPAVSFTIG